MEVEDLIREELEKRANALGLELIDEVPRTELIRRIQRKEGNRDCFGKCFPKCDQFQCCFREGCLNPLRIMVVDDEEGIRSLYANELEDLGYIVEVVRNGEEALEKLPIFKPCIVTLDIKMPGIGGIETLKRIREQTRNLPVIICSAYGEYKQDFTTWASDAYVAKNADLTDLISEIKRCLALAENPHEMETSRLRKYISLLRERNESLEKQLEQLSKDQNHNTARPLERIERINLVKFLRLLSQSYQLANHDIMNTISAIEGAVATCKKTVQKILDDRAELAESQNFHHISSALSKCFEIIDEEGGLLTKYLSSFYRLYSEYPSLEDENLLVSFLAAIVGKVREQNANASIDILDTSPQDLTVIFPPWLLYGIISELVKNAIHHAGPTCRTIIEWKMEGDSLEIGIHDSGKCMGEELEKSYYPFQEFCEIQTITRKKGSGLQLISSILVLAGGAVLFTKSPRLGGLLVHVRIPVLPHSIQGT